MNHTDTLPCHCAGCRAVLALKGHVPLPEDATEDALRETVTAVWQALIGPQAIEVMLAAAGTWAALQGAPVGTFLSGPPRCWRCAAPSRFSQIVILCEPDERLHGCALLYHCTRHQPGSTGFSLGQLHPKTWGAETEEFRAAKPVPLRQRLREWLHDRIGV